MTVCSLMLVLLLSSCFVRASEIVESDLCIYGGTSGGIAAAVQATRMGKSVSLAVFNTHLGGLTSGGLGATDVGTIASIGGVSREFYRRIGQAYGVTERFNFEPKVARQIFESWLAEIGVAPRWNQRLASVVMEGRRIAEIRMEDGTIYRAKMFIDATYEGDLMDMAGVSFTFGREGTNTYGESLNGIRASTPAHQFTVNVDPYVIPGNPASELIPFIQGGTGGAPGDGDSRIQAFNYRLCFTQNATNRLPHAVPPDYNPARYELLGRLIEARLAAGQTLTMGSFFNVSSMPNGKTDMNNNGAFSTDYIGMNYTYPTNSFAARAAMERDHLEYIQGLIQFLGTSPRSPASLRAEVLNWGPTKDEWIETGGYSPQIYVREARRMVGNYVMTQSDCQSTRIAMDPICLGSYNMDSHNCQRIVQGGYVRNEGDVQVGVPRPYPISYRSIIPRVGECENLFVTFAISASHIAFGSTRMEPVFMMASQAAATAAAFAIDDDLPIQAVSHAKLALQLRADGQVLYWDGAGQSATGIIVDTSDPGATLVGAWESSTSVAGYWGTNYLHDVDTGKGAKSVTYTPALPETGAYHVYLRWTTNPNRATNVPIDIVHATGTYTTLVNQTLSNAVWVRLLTTNFNAGTGGKLVLRNGNTSGYVIADAARWLPADAALPQVEVIATDPVASETGKVAKITFIRPADQAATPLTVQYVLSGSAVNGSDFQALPGAIVLPAGVASTNLLVGAISDSIPEGDKILSLTLQPGAGYSVGVLSNCVVRVLDVPFDAWRFAYFTASELGDPAISGPNADPDQDAVGNFEEFRGGTNPRDEASVLRLTVGLSTNAAQVAFPAGSNRAYTLQYLDRWDAGSWQDLDQFRSAATNRWLIYPDPLLENATNRFYRVVVP